MSDITEGAILPIHYNLFCESSGLFNSLVNVWESHRVISICTMDKYIEKYHQDKIMFGLIIITFIHSYCQWIVSLFGYDICDVIDSAERALVVYFRWPAYGIFSVSAMTNKVIFRSIS